MALLLLLLAAATAKADDCATTPPTKPQKEVEAYLRALVSINTKDRKRRRRVRGPRLPLRGPKHTGAAAFLSKTGPAAPVRTRRRLLRRETSPPQEGEVARGRERQPLARAGKAAASGAGRIKRASTVGGRFGPAPSWTNPLAWSSTRFPSLHSKGAEPGRAPRRGDDSSGSLVGLRRSRAVRRPAVDAERLPARVWDVGEYLEGHGRLPEIRSARRRADAARGRRRARHPDRAC